MFHKTFFFGEIGVAILRFRDAKREPGSWYVHFYDPSLTREILRLLWWGSAAVYDEPFTRVEPQEYTKTFFLPATLHRQLLQQLQFPLNFQGSSGGVAWRTRRSICPVSH